MIYALFFINFHGDREFQGVFSTRETAEAYAARFPDSTFETEECTVDHP